MPGSPSVGSSTTARASARRGGEKVAAALGLPLEDVLLERPTQPVDEVQLARIENLAVEILTILRGANGRQSV